MRGFRRRSALRLRDAATAPFSPMLSVVIVAAAFIWAVFFYFGVIALSCAQLVALSLQGAPGLPGAALLFILIFVALASLWLIDVLRPKTGRTGVIRRLAEGLLIAACLYSSLVHYAFLRPMTPEGRMILAVHEGPGSVFRYGQQTLLETWRSGDDRWWEQADREWADPAASILITVEHRDVYELWLGLTFDQRRAREDYALGPAGPAWQPLSGRNGRCTCFNAYGDELAEEHRRIDWHEAEGIGHPAVLAAWRARLDPRPEPPAWCEAAVAPVRYPY